MTIIKFPRNICIPLKYEKPLPRQSVFYLGVVYTGPPLCQDVTELYLKRNGKINGARKWSLITYGKYDEFDKRNYSLELDICDEDDVPDMLCQYNILAGMEKFSYNYRFFNDLRKIWLEWERIQ